jgi:predicted Zn-dependent peptidase
MTTRVDADGAGVFLAGPPEGLDTVLHHLLARLSAPDRISEGQMKAAWRNLQVDWERWSRNPEVLLRQKMAAHHYGEHPYGVGLAQVAPVSLQAPEHQRAASWLRERYQAGAAQILVAGDLNPEDFLSRYLVDFDALEGRSILPKTHPRVSGQTGRIEQDGISDLSQLIVQFPGLMGEEFEAPAMALMAGVLQQLLANDIVGAGLAQGASAYFDFTAPGSRPLEVQVRQFYPDKLEQVEERLDRIFERLRQGEFSNYQVITAKDFLYQVLDASGAKGEGPTRKDADGLINWNWNVLQRQLHFRRWRAGFEAQALGTGKEQIAAVAKARLWPERATFGLILAPKKLE